MPAWLSCPWRGFGAAVSRHLRGLTTRAGALPLLVTLVAVLGTIGWAPASVAQGFPSKPVRITSPYSPGIAPDVISRVVADALGRLWGQQVLVEPRPGGNGFIATNGFRKAAPDGHELLLLGNAHLTINPTLLKDVPYDPVRDFVPVGLLYRTSYFLAVAADSPHQTLPALIAAARANPGRITYTSAYVGSPLHLAGALLAHLTGTTMTPVHFKDTGQMYGAVANGDVGFAVGTAGALNALVRGGRLRLVAAIARERLPTHPDVPTVREAGAPDGFEVDTWAGLFAPPGTPADVVARINADLARVLADPAVVARYRPIGAEPALAAPDAITTLIRADLKTNAELIRRIGITPE